MKIRFNDYVERYDDRQCWSQICTECAKKYKVPTHYLDADGEGICGVKGCNNEIDYEKGIDVSYIDFPSSQATQEEVGGHKELVFEFDENY